MKITSWNVNSIKARQDHALQWLKTNTPDILLMQELKGETINTDCFQEIGYHTAYVGQKAYNGVAILSRTAFTPARQSLPEISTDTEQFDPQARYIEADINNIKIINIYLPNGNPTGTDKFTYKISWMKRLYAHIKTLRDQSIPFLIGGDFNVIPEDKDCYDPALWANDALFATETREQWRAFLNLGLTDSYRVFNKNAGEYTFWDYQAGAWPRNNGIRIDHFLTSPAITDRLINCTIDKTPRGWEKTSDHTPIILEIS